MPVGFQHDLGYANDVLVLDALVKEVAHRIDKDFAGFLPVQWVIQFVGYKANVKALFKRVPWHPTKALG